MKKFIIGLITIFLFLKVNTLAGWLEVPEQLDAKGLLEQYITTNSPISNTDYTGNIERLGSLLKDGKIFNGVKDDYFNALLSNIHYLLFTKYGIDYGYGKFILSDAEKNILSRLGILQGVENFRYIELNANELKKLGILNTADSYNYFKNNLAPFVLKSLDLNINKYKTDKFSLNGINTIFIAGYPVLVARKTTDNMIIIFKYLFTRKDLLNNLMAFDISYNGHSYIVILGIPDVAPNSTGKMGILSDLAMEKAQLQYMINGKIKYPKELNYCLSGMDASKINTLQDLQNYIAQNCTNLYKVDLNCSSYYEFIGDFNEGTINQYTAVYGLDEKDGLFYVVPIQRFFSKRLVALLPSSKYNPNNNCGYNLYLVDKLSKKVDGAKSDNVGTHRLVWSSRDQGWPTGCSKWNDNSGILEGTADSNNFADSCDITNLPQAFLDKGNDLLVNMGVYMTGDVDNMQLYYGLKDASNNIINMYEVGKYLGFDTVGSGLKTKDLNLGFNNGLYSNGVYTPLYSKVNTDIFIDSNNYPATTQKVEGKEIYTFEINGANSSKLLSSIVPGQYFIKVFDNNDYTTSSLKRYPTFFVFGSGDNSDNKIDLQYLDIGFNDYTTYYLYSIKTLSDGTQKLELQQVLNLDKYNIFYKDIGLDSYDNGDGTKGIFLTFSGQDDFFNFEKWTKNIPESITSANIDIDALKISFGGDGIGRYKQITHLKLVYDPSKDLYVIAQADKGPLSQTFIQGIHLGGILGDILKDCSLANYVNDDLKDCSHDKLLPLNVDNDKENIGNGFINWPEWVYISGSELRIFNNIVKKDAFGNYTVQMKEILYSNNMEYCKKEAQTIDYYKNHNSEDTALKVTEGDTTYLGYSPDENSGVAIVLKQGDLKFVFKIDSNSTNFFNKTYVLSQVITDTANSIQCDY